MQSSSALAVMVAGGVLIYALSKKSNDNPGAGGSSNKTPTPPPTLSILPGPVGADPTIKGYRSDYPSTWPAGDFCALNKAFQTPRFEMNPDPYSYGEFVSDEFGCDPANQNTCIPILSFSAALGTVSQDDCLNYLPGTADEAPIPSQLYGLASSLIGAKSPQNPGPPGWVDGQPVYSSTTGWPDPGGPLLIWFDPLRQVATYKGFSGTTNVDASAWAYGHL